MITIQESIATLVELGVPSPGIRAALLKQGYSPALIEEAMPKSKRTCFVNDYYDYLSAEPRTLDEAKEYIMSPENSDNVHKYLKMHLNVAELAAKIWADK